MLENLFWSPYVFFLVMVTVLLLLLLYGLNMSDLESLILLRLALQLDHFFITVLCVIEKEKHNFYASSIL